jgi:5'-nucleotidase
MILGLFCLLTISPHATAQQQAPQTKTITILQLNDVYQISPVDRGRRGGMARVATIRKTILSQSPNTLFLLAGDFISPSVASRFFKGKQMIDTLNSAGLDIATLGNHEFDFGPDVLRQRMKESRFTYTIANVFDKQTGQPFGGARQYIIREMGGVRVAIFGLLLPETSSMSNPGEGVRFEDPVKVGARLSRKLRGDGADVVIALTHLPMHEDKRLAAQSDVDLIVGGHEHELLEAQAAGRLILKMGSDARNLGRIDINLVQSKNKGNRRGLAARGYRSKPGAGFKIQSIDFVPVPVTDGTKDDEQVAVVVAGYEKELNASLSEVIGKTSVMLDARASAVRFYESNLGNFIADVYRQTLDTDVALVNGGSIRSDATYGPGELTKKDILTILPFENTLVKVRLQGAHIKRLLENGVSAAGQEDGRFPHVSGMSFTYDASKPVGSRVTGIQIGSQPLEAQKTYTMAVTAYVLGGGDGYDFKGAEQVIKPEDGPIEPDVVMEAIKKQGTISPQVEGRIKSAQHVNKTSLLFFNLFSKPDIARTSNRKAA